MSRAGAGTTSTRRAGGPGRPHGRPVTTTRAGVPRSSAQQRFDERLSAQRRRTYRLLGAFVAVLAAVAGVWWVLWRSDWMVVESVVVSGVEERWVAQVSSAAAIDLSQPMVQVDTEGAVLAVQELSFVKEVAVVRSWPSTITVEAVPRVPVLAVRQSPSRFALVDDEGVTIETVPAAPDGVPVLVTQGRSGSTQEAYRAAWAVLSSLPRTLTGQVTGATLSSADLLTLQLGERTLVWGGPQDLELKLQVAEALLASGEVYVDVSAPRTPVTRPS